MDLLTHLRTFGPDIWDSKIKLVRHPGVRSKEGWDVEMLLREGFFDQYQRHQKDPKFDGCQFILSFMGEGGSRSRFIGCWRVDGVHEGAVPPPEGFPYPDMKFGPLRYDLEPVGGFDLLENCLVIDWQGGNRNWVQKFDPNTPMPVVEMLPRQRVASSHSWVFQGNPDLFDVEGYLSHDLPFITWTLRQHREAVREGDTVYLWRAAGRKRAVSGIVARATVASPPWFGREEAAGGPYWHSPPDEIDSWRVWLRLDRAANKKQVIKRNWLKEDPVCRDLPFLKQPAGTNFPLEGAFRARIDRLWDRTGDDWTHGDSVAGLWAYDRTYRHEVSRLPGSPVAEVAVRIGRAVGGVYNKVMNFRALDPRDKRVGLRAGSEIDARVWEEYFDSEKQMVRSAALETDYIELWGDITLVDIDSAQIPDPQHPPAPTGDTPGRRVRTVERIVRRTSVTEWVKQVHDHTCQVCGVRLAGPSGPVAEGAHIRPLGGEHEGRNHVGNVLCLCPNHHALFDRGAFFIAKGMRIRAVCPGDYPDRLRIRNAHAIDDACLQYHRQRIARWDGGGPSP